jgi:hypothetical protein
LSSHFLFLGSTMYMITTRSIGTGSRAGMDSKRSESISLLGGQQQTMVPTYSCTHGEGADDRLTKKTRERIGVGLLQSIP